MASTGRRPQTWRTSGVEPGRAAVAFCGFSGAGKTTLLERLIPRLVDRGLAVAVVKHDAHGVAIDTPGKDSDRLFRAGADVVVRGPNESAARSHPGTASELEPTLTRLLENHDLVLVEGHKTTPLPKLWLATRDGAAAPHEAGPLLAALPWDGNRVGVAEAIVVDLLDAVVAERRRLGGLLVGGASRRMGRAKQLVELGGSTLGERAVVAIADHVDEVVLLGAGAAPRSLRSLRRLPDPPGRSGPLAGLLAALRWAPAACWVVAACDLAQVEQSAIEWLLGERRPGVWAVLPEVSDRVEPLLAVYEPQARTLLERLPAEGAPRLLADHQHVATPSPPAGLEPCWANVNTPLDLAAIVGGER